MPTQRVMDRNKRIADECYAAEEPFFVVRAKDQLSVAALLAYLTAATREATTNDQSGVTQVFLTELDVVRQDFLEWRALHADQLKTPDLRPEELADPNVGTVQKGTAEPTPVDMALIEGTLAEQAPGLRNRPDPPQPVR